MNIQHGGRRLTAVCTLSFVFFIVLATVLVAGAQAGSGGGGGGAGGAPGAARAAAVRPQIAVGNEFTMILKADGSLWASGLNFQGQLGLGDRVDRLDPTRVGGDNDWVAVACGQRHTVALKADGSLWAWGDNDNGQLGLGTTSDFSLVPTLVPGGGTWIAIAGGDWDTAAIKSDGSLWCWGKNVYGQVGDGTTGGDKTVPTAVSGGGTWTAVACGQDHMAGIKSDGSLWCWGRNASGGLGDNTTIDKHVPTPVSGGGVWSTVNCGYFYTAAIKSDGSLWSWGDNGWGQVGDNTTATKLVPTPVSGGGTWRSVSAGSQHTLAIKSDGSLWSWGCNTSGELGDNTTTSRHVPTAVSGGGTWSAVATGYCQSAGLKSDGSLYAWGFNTDGRLGDGTHSQKLTPHNIPDVGTGAGWSARAPRVAGGETHTAVIRADGSLWTWGSNSYGELGLGDTTDRGSPTRVGTANDWVAVACGYYHTVAIRADGSLWAWGSNSNGQLGDTTTTDRLVPTAISGGGTWSAVAGGQYHTVAIKADGSLWAWGANYDGQLGDGSTTERHQPTVVSGGGTWSAVAGGSYHTVALKSDGSVWTWGLNNYGQLGDTTRTEEHAPTPVSGGGTWSAVAAGCYHTVAIKADGSLWLWGFNGNGELGDGTGDDKLAPIPVWGGGTWSAVACGVFHTIGLKADGSLRCWGFNGNGQLGDGSTDEKHVPVSVSGGGIWSVIAGGGFHTVAVRAGGGLWAWGANWRGQLGDGSTTDRHVPTATVDLGDTLPPTIDTLTSSTHPVQTDWYAGNTPTFSWTASDVSGVAGFSCVVDRSTTTTPDTVADGTALTYTSPALAGGVWYFHLRVVDTFGNWSAPRHFAVHIDCTPPITTDNAPMGWQNSSPVDVNLMPSDGPLSMRRDHAAGTAPRSVAVADLNGDGAKDLAVANTTSSNVSILLGNGDGTFATHVDYPVGTNPTSIAVGDFNGDGKKDLAVTNRGDDSELPGTVSILMGNGDGTFATHADYAVGTTPCGIAVADFNGDGKDDLAVANGLLDVPTPGSISILLNDGSGGFGTHTDIPSDVGIWPYAIAAGDFNGDHKADLAVANQSGEGATLGDHIAVLLGDGVGGFAAPAVVFDSGPPNPVSLAVGDFDHDGNADLAVAKQCSNPDPTTPGICVVLFGDGSGSFPSSTPDLDVGLLPYSIAAGDLNGDGNPDLAVANQGSNDVSVILGDGSGGFFRHVDYAAGTQPASVAVGDLDGDGNLDLAVANQGSDDVSVLAGDGSGMSGGLATTQYKVDGATTWSTGTTLSVSGDGMHTVLYRSIDAAGNREVSKRCRVSIDTTPPVTTIYGIDSAWQAWPLVVYLSATDAGSGMMGGMGAGQIEYNLDDGGWVSNDWVLIASDGDHTLQVRSTDAVGNTEIPQTVHVGIDSVAPVTTDDAGGGWHAAPFSLSLTPTDPLSGMSSGLAKTEYSQDGGTTWTQGRVVTYRVLKRGGGSGVHTLLYRSTDAAGNLEETRSCEVRIDARAPITTNDAPLASQESDVTVHFTASDNLFGVTASSGVKETWYRLDGGGWVKGTQVTVAAAGNVGLHWIAYYSTDNAGNTEYVKWCSVTIAAGGAGGHAARAQRRR